MSTEKKIIFTAQDNNVAQKANQIYSSILPKSKEYSTNLKEQTAYIEKQVRELEKKARLEQKTGNAILKEQESLLAAARTPRERAKYEERVNRVKNDLSDSTTVLETLKELLNETKRQNSRTEKVEKETAKKLRLEEDRYQSQKSLWRQEVQYDKQGVKDRIKAAEKNNFKDMTPEQVEKLMFQKTMSGGEGKDRGIFGQVFAGTLAAGIVQKIGSTLSTIASASTGEQAFNSLLGGVPFVGDVLSKASQRNFEEQYAVGTGVKRLRALTGYGGLRIGGNNHIGFSTRENTESAANLIPSSGFAGGYDKYGNQSSLLERGLSFSPQLINQLVKDIRSTSNNADLLKVVSYALNANPELRKDQTRFSEILTQTSQLTNQLISQSENISLKQNAGVVGALRSIGGTFADPVLGGQRMLSINNALTNPGNDFQKARSFGVLSGLKPGMSYFQTLEAQEKGIGQEGYLEGLLKQLERETGGGENLMLSVQQNLGLGASTSRRLVEARRKNPNIFGNFKGGTEDIESILGLTNRAVDSTSRKDREAAEMSDKYLRGTFNGLSEGIKQTVDVIKDAATNFAREMGMIPAMFTVPKRSDQINDLYNE